MLTSIKLSIGFGSSDEAILHSLREGMGSHLDGLCVTPGPQLEPVDDLIREWLREILTRSWDEGGMAVRVDLGRRFAQLGLPRHRVYAEVNEVRTLLVDAALEKDLGVEGLRAAVLAIGKFVDLELAVLLHGFGEDGLERAKRRGRLATLGELAASIGHELRNPLGVIDASVFLLRRRLGPDERFSAHLDRIEGQVRISSRIIDDLLEIATERAPIGQPVELAPLVEAARDAVSFSPRGRLSVDVPADLPKAKADAGQLRQVLVNLLSNAVDAAGADGEIRVELRAEPRWLAIAVSDSGGGVDPSLGLRIFEPLVTTKTRGIGLGLSLCKRLIERSGGTIALEPGPLPGACFVVRLPLDDQAEGQGS